MNENILFKMVKIKMIHKTKYTINNGGSQRYG